MDEDVFLVSEDDQPAAGDAPADPTEPATLHEALARSEHEHSRALDALRSALLASEPAISPEMVGGATLDEVQASFAAAREQVERLREAVRREQMVAVPAGAPGRAPEPGGSPFDKIRRGLERLANP